MKNLETEIHILMKKMKDVKEYEWWNPYIGFFRWLFSSNINDVVYYFPFPRYYLWKSQEAISKFNFLKTEWSLKSKNDIL